MHQVVAAVVEVPRHEQGEAWEEQWEPEKNYGRIYFI